MITVDVGAFRAKMVLYLKELPICLTRYGRPVGYVVQDIKRDVQDHKDVVQDIPSVVQKPTIKDLGEKKGVTSRWCEHNSLKGLCKHGCK